MSNMPDPDPLRHWLELMNKAHGYAGQFNYARGTTDKPIVEISTAAEWCRSVAEESGLEVGEPSHNPADPPDCWVEVAGQRLGVELVQMVDDGHKRRAMAGESPWTGELFFDMQWTQERLATKLRSIVQDKGDRYAHKGVHIDALVIYTDEPWLEVDQAKAWLAEIEIAPHPSIAAVFLMFSYRPGTGFKHWPVLLLCGGPFGRMLSIYSHDRGVEQDPC